MFGKTTQGDLNGFLDAGSHMEGELRFDDTFRIDGRITGRIVSDGELIVGERGEIEGEVEVRRIYVSGIVRGKLDAGEYLEITPTGRVFADLETPSLKIEEGAVFEGQCTMKGEKGAEGSESHSGGKVTPMPVAQGSSGR